MVYSDDGMSEYEQSTSSLVVPTQLELVDEITRLSRIHIDLAAAMERQTRLIAKLQDDLRVVARDTTRNAETLFDRAVNRIDAFEQEYRGRGQLLSDLMWYPTWSETAPVLGEPLISVVMPTRNRRTLLSGRCSRCNNRRTRSGRRSLSTTPVATTPLRLSARLRPATPGSD